MLPIKEKTLRDEKNLHLNENIYIISSSSLPIKTISSNTTFLPIDRSETTISVEKEEKLEEVMKKDINIAGNFKLIDNNNINLKMLSNNDNNNDFFYDPTTKSIYDPYKIIEDEIPNLSQFSPENDLCDFDENDIININTDNYDHKLISSQDNPFNLDLLNVIDSIPISDGSLDEYITSNDCIPTNELHIFSQTESILTDNNNNNINNNNLNDNDDIDYDMEKLQNLDIPSNINNAIKTESIANKRKMETITNLPTKKKCFNLKLDTTLKISTITTDLKTARVIDTVLELEEEVNKFKTTDNYKSDVQLPESKYMSTTNNMSTHEFSYNSISPLLDVGTENAQQSFFQNNNNNNINEKNFNINHCDESNQSLNNTYLPSNVLLIKNNPTTSISSSSQQILWPSNDILIKIEDPPSVESSSNQILWSTDDISIDENYPQSPASSSNHIFTSISNDYSCSTAPTTPLSSSCQSKRKRGRPRIEHRSEPTKKELENLTEKDRKQKLLRAKNNKASQVSRDKKRSKAQQIEYERNIEEDKNKLLNKEYSRLQMIESELKNICQRWIEKRRK